VLRPLAAAVLTALAAAAPLAADEIHLKNGRVLQGDVLEEDGDELVIRTGSGITVRLPRADVVRVEEAATPQEEFAARFAALELEARDVDAFLAWRSLARWAEAQEGLSREARDVREGILERWPDDPETRRVLGYVRHEGRWVTRADYMADLGLVESEDGRTWLTEEEAARRRAEAAAEAAGREVRRLLRGAASGDVEEIAARLAGYSDAAAVPVLERHLEPPRSLACRTLAMRELARRRAGRSAAPLAEAAVEDPQHEARDAALAAIADLPSEARAEAGRYFLRSLTRDHAFQRVHAVKGAGAFPVAGVVPALILMLRESSGGFGRSSISVVTQRAYIRDFELTSGGTGQVVAEVADPEVDTFSEGVSLDMKVILWERYTVVKVLRRLTGQGFGADPETWRDWWRREKDAFELPGD